MHMGNYLPRGLACTSTLYGLGVFSHLGYVGGVLSVLLGLLRQHDLYGYQINEMIDAHLGSSINLTRPTAYRLLHNMAEQGWISYREEKIGKRPTRRIYALTASGEAAFQELL